MKWVTYTKQFEMRTRLVVKIKKCSECMSHNRSGVTNRLMHNVMCLDQQKI